MSAARIVRCPHCGTNNRVSTVKLDHGMDPICGKCKRPLPMSARIGPVTVTDSTFQSEVETSELPVLVDLWAAWCGPCRMISPMIDELASEMSGRVKFAKLNIDENPGTANRFRVNSIPTLLIFKRGRELDRIVGVTPKDQIKHRLEKIA